MNHFSAFVPGFSLSCYRNYPWDFYYTFLPGILQMFSSRVFCKNISKFLLKVFPVLPQSSSRKFSRSSSSKPKNHSELSAKDTPGISVGISPEQNSQVESFTGDFFRILLRKISWNILAVVFRYLSWSLSHDILKSFIENSFRNFYRIYC